MDAILVIWLFVSDKSELSLWKLIKTELIQIAENFFSESNDIQKSVEKDIQKSLEEADEETVTIDYCTNQWSSVKESLKQAISEGAKQAIVIPAAFALDKQYSETAQLVDLTEKLTEFESKYPEIELIYFGPPFESKQKFSLIFSEIHEQEPERVYLIQDVIERGFEGDWSLFTEFMQKIQEPLPRETRVAIRGSVLTGQNWISGEAFDAEGEGTSDVDIVLVGKEVMSEWKEDAFYIPEVNTVPLSDKKSDIAPALNSTREELQEMVGRKVNIQAMTKWFLDLRYYLLGQPYLFLD